VSLGHAARAYAGHRFPALAARRCSARVCQYDLSTDTHFIVDRHEQDSWWLIGGVEPRFKHGPLSPSASPTASKDGASAGRSTPGAHGRRRLRTASYG
jgi:hypothetical protein